MQRIPGIVISIGSLLFIIGVATPITLSVFGASNNPALQAEMIRNSLTQWKIACAISGAGGAIAAIGLLLFAQQIQSRSSRKNTGTLSYIAAALAVVAGFLWAAICYGRIVRPPEVVTNNLNFVPWMYPVYTLFTLIAMILFGIVLLQSGYPKWLGWVMLVAGGLFLIVYLVSRDIPPGVYYPVLLVMGITLIITPRPRQISKTNEMTTEMSGPVQRNDS